MERKFPERHNLVNKRRLPCGGAFAHRQHHPRRVVDVIDVANEMIVAALAGEAPEQFAAELSSLDLIPHLLIAVGGMRRVEAAVRVRRREHVDIRILILVLVVTALVSGVTIYAVQESKLKKESDEKAKKIAEILQPLKDERKAIENQMDQIISDFKTGQYSEGTIMFLVTDTDSRLYTEIYRLLIQSTIPGLIAVDESFPNENSITVQELRSLESTNWDIVMKGDKDTDFVKLSNAIQAMNLKKPQAIYFEKDAYDESLNETILDLNIQTIIAYDTIINIEGIAHSYKAYGYKETDFKDFLGSSINDSNTIAITVGYNNSYELYDNSDFSKVLTQVEGNVSYELIAAGNITLANARYDSINQSIVQRKKEMLMELDRLQEEHDLIQKRIDEESKKIER